MEGERLNIQVWGIVRSYLKLNFDPQLRATRSGNQPLFWLPNAKMELAFKSLDKNNDGVSLFIAGNQLAISQTYRRPDCYL